MYIPSGPGPGLELFSTGLSYGNVNWVLNTSWSPPEVFSRWRSAFIYAEETRESNASSWKQTQSDRQERWPCLQDYLSMSHH